MYTIHKTVSMWFKQKQMEGVPISGPIWNKKAVAIHKKTYREDSSVCGIQDSNGGFVRVMAFIFRPSRKSICGNQIHVKMKRKMILKN